MLSILKFSKFINKLNAVFLVPRNPLKKAENINFPRVFLLLCCSHKTYMKFLFGFLLSFVRATDAHRSILELCCSSSIIAAAFHPLHATHSMPFAPASTPAPAPPDWANRIEAFADCITSTTAT